MLGYGGMEFLQTPRYCPYGLPSRCIILGFYIEIETFHHLMNDFTKLIVCQVKMHLFYATAFVHKHWAVSGHFRIVNHRAWRALVISRVRKNTYHVTVR